MAKWFATPTCEGFERYQTDRDEFRAGVGPEPDGMFRWSAYDQRKNVDDHGEGRFPTIEECKAAAEAWIAERMTK